MARSRNFIFVINNYTPEEVEVVKGWDCKYLIFGKEIGEEGTPHLQGYVCFENQMTLSALKKKYSVRNNHWEPARGTPQRASDYCKKGLQSHAEFDELGLEGPNYGRDADVFEKGTRPLSPPEKGTGEKRRWEAAFCAVKEGRLEDVPADILCTKLKSVEYAVKRVAAAKWDLSTIPGGRPHRWVYGQSGCGKSRSVREAHPDAFIKDPRTPWWDGYDGEEVVIIDDYDPYQIKQSGDMKRWLDLYKFQAQVKGGYLMIRPRVIIVTSQYTIRECFGTEDEKTFEAMNRRVEVTHIPYPLYPLAPTPAGSEALGRQLEVPSGERPPEIDSCLRAPDPAGAERHAGGPESLGDPDPYLDDQAHFDKFGYYLLG